MIPQRNLSVLSNHLARGGGRRIPEAVLERDYCLAWFLVGLSRSSLREHLVFKGGTALKRCYFGDYRFSEDLDFTLASKIPLESILVGLEEVYAQVRSASGIPIHYSREDRTKHENSHTFRPDTTAGGASCGTCACFRHPCPVVSTSFSQRPTCCCNRGSTSGSATSAEPCPTPHRRSGSPATGGT